jgi:hypothetical protein
MPTDSTDKAPGQATVVLVFPGWTWRSYTGVAPMVLVAIDRQVYFPGEVSKGFRFELELEPGLRNLTVMLGGNSRTIPIEVEAGRTYEIPLKFGGRWGALKIEFPESSTATDPV